MNRMRLLTVGVAALALAVGGGVVAGGMQDAPPQDATPAADPVAEEIRRQLNQESAPAGDPAPEIPVALVPPSPSVVTADVVGDPVAETVE